MRVWLNGRLVAAEDAGVSPFDRGFLLGDGVFETIAVHHGRPFDLDAHLARLAAGLDVLGFASAVDLAGLRRDLHAYCAAERLADAVLRLTATRGSGPRGLAPPDDPTPTLLMSWAPMPPKREAPIAVVIATTTRRNDASPLARIKALPYLDNLLALREARGRGADEALLLNIRGMLTGATTANLFVLLDGWLVTPALSDGALPGTMRARVMAIAQDAGLPTHEGPIAPDIFADADAVFLTNSVRGIMPVGSVDGVEVGRRADGHVARLRARLADVIGSDRG